jgi:hypothetical protein
MMMAPDSTPKQPELSAQAVASLRKALLAYLETHEAPALERALNTIATEARASSMHAEQLLIALKDVWFSLPHMQDTSVEDEQARLLQRVVSLCIRAYYAA